MVSIYVNIHYLCIVSVKYKLMEIKRKFEIAYLLEARENR